MRGSIAEALCLRLEKKRGESALRLLIELQLLDRRFKIGREGDQLLIPLLRSPSKSERCALQERLSDFQIGTYVLTQLPHKPRTIIEALRGKLPPHKLASLPRSLDVIGDIAIVELPEELQGSEALIGKAILEANKSLRLVLAKAGPVSTERRVRQLQVIAGSGATETTHREYGCSFRLDVAKVYFSPRLAHEHQRVANQVREGETVIDMFAGVGPFAIQIAKRRRIVRVYAIDINEDAVRYLQENVSLNGVDEKVTAIRGDARTVIETYLTGKVDRVIMNLPAEAVGYVRAACLAIKPSGGVTHYYTFAKDPNPVERAREELSEAVLRAGRKIDQALCSRIVKGTAPHEWLVAFDIRIE